MRTTMLVHGSNMILRKKIALFKICLLNKKRFAYLLVLYYLLSALMYRYLCQLHGPMPYTLASHLTPDEWYGVRGGPLKITSAAVHRYQIAVDR